MNNTHKQPEESGAVLVSVDGTLPTAADLHVRIPGNPEEWRRKLEALKEPGVVRWFLTVGDCLAHEAGTRKGRRLDRKSTRLNSSHTDISRMPSSA